MDGTDVVAIKLIDCILAATAAVGWKDEDVKILFINKLVV